MPHPNWTKTDQAVKNNLKTYSMKILNYDTKNRGF